MTLSLRYPLANGLALLASATLSAPALADHRPSDDVAALRFVSGSSHPSPGLDPALASLNGSPRFAFVGLHRPITARTRALLRGAGARLLGYHPDRCLKVVAPTDALRRLASLDSVRFVARQPDTLRVHPALAATLNDPSGQRLALHVSAMDRSTASLKKLAARLRGLGAAVSATDPGLGTLTLTLPARKLALLASWEAVLFVERQLPVRLEMDEAVAMIGADLGRVSSSGKGVIAGIIDSGLNRIHGDLKAIKGRGWCYTNQGGPYDDYTGHGTIVAGIMMGRGIGDPRYTGVAPGLGATDSAPLLVGKIVTSGGGITGADKAIDQFVKGSAAVGKPQVVNCSWSIKQSRPPGDDPGSSYWARKVDHAVYSAKEVFVYAAGNGMDTDGNGKVDYYGPKSIKTPGLAKNALAVGAVVTSGFGKAGSVWSSSGKGPTRDGRLKPNVVAPGTGITSVWGTKSSGYASASGTSFAAPVVTAFVARLLEQRKSLWWHPSAVRALVMASAIPLQGKLANIGNAAGLGRISADLLLGKRDSADGWQLVHHSGSLAAGKHGSHDVTVPANTRRLTAVLTWDEPPASAGAARAVANDLDLWLDSGDDQGKPDGSGGEWKSISKVDNSEVVAVDNPKAGKLKLKVVANAVPLGAPQRYDVALLLARGDPAPKVDITLRSEAIEARVGTTVGLVLEVKPRSFVLGGAVVKLELPSHARVLSATTARRDGISLLQGGGKNEIVLGDIPVGSARKARFVISSTKAGSLTVGASLHAVAFSGPGKARTTVWFCDKESGCAPKDAGPPDSDPIRDRSTIDRQTSCPRQDAGPISCPSDDGCNLGGQSPRPDQLLWIALLVGLLLRRRHAG